MTYLISVFSVYTKLETLSINILIAVASDFESAIRAGSLAGGWWMSSEGVWLYGGWWNVLNGLALLLAPTFAAALWNKGGWIQKRAKAQKKNPWKEEIFTDTRDYQEAMARAK